MVFRNQRRRREVHHHMQGKVQDALWLIFSGQVYLVRTCNI